MTTATGTPAPAAGEAPPTPAPAGDAAPASEAPTPNSPAPAQEGGSAAPGGEAGATQGEGGEASATETPSETPAADYSGLTVPEGMPEGHLDQVRAYATQLGLTPEQAQQFVDRDAGLLKAQLEGAMSAQAAAVEQWKAEVQNDPDLGGLHLPTTNVRAETVLQRFDPGGELRELLEQSGHIHHPAVKRVLAGIGLAMEPGQVAPGEPPAPAPKSWAERMYPNDV